MGKNTQNLISESNNNSAIMGHCHGLTAHSSIRIWAQWANNCTVSQVICIICVWYAVIAASGMFIICRHDGRYTSKMQEIVKNYVNSYGCILRLYLTHRFWTKLRGTLKHRLKLSGRCVEQGSNMAASTTAIRDRGISVTTWGGETSRKYRCSRRQLCWPEVRVTGIQSG